MRILPLLLLTACRHEPPVETSETGKPAPGTFGSVGHVLWLVPDGTRADESVFDGESSVFLGDDDAPDKTADAIVPWLRSGFAAQGTVISPGYSTGITVTSEAHGTILSGVRVPTANYTAFSGPGHFLSEVPTIYEILRRKGDLASDQVALLANYHHLSGHGWSLYPGYGEDWGSPFTFISARAVDPTADSGAPADDDNPVFDSLEEKLATADVRFALANLHWIDGAAHTESPEGYAAALTVADGRLQTLWDWIQSTPPYKDDTVLVVAADHGRHRREVGFYDMRDHGDECAGCRQIPMFLAGPGIVAGQELVESYTLEDLTRTVAWLLGERLPWGTGLLMKDALVTPTDETGTSGQAWPSVSGTLSADQAWTPNPRHATTVEVDGAVVSSPDAFLAEAPTVLESGGWRYACWRELAIEDGEYIYDDFPWTGRCRYQAPGGTWKDLALPDTAFPPYFKASLAADQDGARLWLTWADNPAGIWHNNNDCYTRVLRWTEAGGWAGDAPEDGQAEVLFPMDPTVAVIDGTAFVAYATSTWSTDETWLDESGRYTRHVEVHRLDWPEGITPVWNLVELLDVYDAGFGLDPTNPVARRERPQLLNLGGTLWLASVAYGDDIGATLSLTHSEDAGFSWSDEVFLDDTGRTVGWVPASWSPDGDLYWARVTASDTVEVCRTVAATVVTTCQDTGSVALQGLAATDGGVRVAVVDGTNHWTLKDLADAR